MKNSCILFIFLILTTVSFAKTDNLKPNQKVLNELESLKKKNGSLAKRLDNIEKNDYKSIDVIEKINGFYESAWNKLLYVLGGAGTLILFLVPYYINKSQKETISLKTKEFEDLVNIKINTLESKIAQYHADQFKLLKEEIDSNQAAFSSKLEEDRVGTSIYIYVLRGMIAEVEKNYNAFFKFYISATERSIGRTSDTKSLLDQMTKKISHCISNNIKISEATRTKLTELVKKIEQNFNEELSESLENFRSKIDELSFK